MNRIKKYLMKDFGGQDRTTAVHLYKFAMMAFTLSASAQTNFFPLLPIGGATYTNATIRSVTAADAVVTFDGGGARVALSNLPAELQKRYGYDPKKAAALLDQRRARDAAYRKQQAELESVANALGDEMEVSIISIGYNGRCQTSAGEMFIQGIPGSIDQLFSEYERVSSQVAAMEDQIENNERAAQYANAAAPTFASGDPAYVDAVMAQRARANAMAISVEDQKKQLEKLKSAQRSLLESTVRSGNIVAAKTSRKYAGLEIWKFVRSAPIK